MSATMASCHRNTLHHGYHLWAASLRRLYLFPVHVLLTRLLPWAALVLSFWGRMLAAANLPTCNAVNAMVGYGYIDAVKLPPLPLAARKGCVALRNLCKPNPTTRSSIACLPFPYLLNCIAPACRCRPLRCCGRCIPRAGRCRQHTPPPSLPCGQGRSPSCCRAPSAFRRPSRAASPRWRCACRLIR